MELTYSNDCDINAWLRLGPGITLCVNGTDYTLVSSDTDNLMLRVYDENAAPTAADPISVSWVQVESLHIY